MFISVEILYGPLLLCPSHSGKASTLSGRGGHVGFWANRPDTKAIKARVIKNRGVLSGLFLDLAQMAVLVFIFLFIRSCICIIYLYFIRYGGDIVMASHYSKSLRHSQNGANSVSPKQWAIIGMDGIEWDIKCSAARWHKHRCRHNIIVILDSVLILFFSFQLAKIHHFFQSSSILEK